MAAASEDAMRGRGASSGGDVQALPGGVAVQPAAGALLALLPCCSAAKTGGRGSAYAGAITEACARRPLAAIIASGFLAYMGLGLSVIVFPLLVNVMLTGGIEPTEDSEGAYGLLLMCNQMGQLAMANFWGVVSDRWGRRPFLFTAACGSVALYFTAAVTPSYWALLAMITVEGMTATFYSVGQAYVADVSAAGTRASRGANFGLYLGVSVGLGFAAGVPLSAGLADATDSVRLPFTVACVLAVVNVLVIGFVMPESLPRRQRSEVVWRKANPCGAVSVLRRSKFISWLGASYSFMQLAQAGVQVIWINYSMARYNWTLTENALFFIVMGVSLAVLPRVMIPRFGMAKCAVYGAAFSTFAYAVMAFVAHGWLLLLIMPGLMLGDVAYPAVLGLLSAQVGAHEQGAMQGLTDTLKMAAQAVGSPVVAVFFGYTLDPSSGIPIGAPMFLLAAFFAAAFGCVWYAFHAYGDQDVSGGERGDHELGTIQGHEHDAADESDTHAMIRSDGEEAADHRYGVIGGDADGIGGSAGGLQALPAAAAGAAVLDHPAPGEPAVAPAHGATRGSPSLSLTEISLDADTPPA